MALTEGTPSYARPTQASSNHKQATENNMNVLPSSHRISAVTSQTQLDDIGTPSNNVNAKRNIGRRRTRQPFRFLSLPPELRNRVYEYTGLERLGRYADLSNPRRWRPSRAMPRLLQVNKQICDEAGSYYFNTTTAFELLLDPLQLRRFRLWLSLIGPANRARLAANRNMHVRLVQPRRPAFGYIHDLSVTVICISFGDAAYTFGLDVACAKVFPQLPSWKISSVPMHQVEEWRNGGYGPIPHYRTIRLAVVDAQQVRKVMKIVISCLGGKTDDKSAWDYMRWLNVRKVCKDHMVVRGRNGSVWDLLK